MKKIDIKTNFVNYAFMRTWLIGSSDKLNNIAWALRRVKDKLYISEKYGED